MLGFNKFWVYERQDDLPYLWAEANFYWYRGQRVAKTVGGSLFKEPELLLEVDSTGKAILPEGSLLEPVNIEEMLAKNLPMLEVLEMSAMTDLWAVYTRYKKKLDCFHVAFSGGKDSVAMLEIVRRTLPENDFLVIFGDTGMEFPDTYELIDKVEEDCKRKGIAFFRAKSHLEPEESWRLFGPPSQVLRWCCSVHKSTPQTLKLREILGKAAYTGMDFVGVRAHESAARSKYDTLNYGKKQKGQYSFNPILDWTSAEVWLYIFYRQLAVNMAYKKGNNRVGCLLCPLGAGGKADWFRVKNYPEQVNKFIGLIKTYINDSSIDSYIRNNAWIQRKNGRDVVSDLDYEERLTSDSYILSANITSPTLNEWLKTIPEYLSTEYTLSTDRKKISINRDLYGTPKSRILRSVFHKASYCINCRTCEANCPHGAIKFKDRLHIIDCTHCGICHSISEGCLRCHSLRKTISGGYDMGSNGNKKAKARGTSLNTFADHAPKREWVINFFRDVETFSNELGPMQRSMFNRFLSDAGLLSKKLPTPLYDFIKEIKYDSPDAWSIILVNLAHANQQMKWYIKNIPLDGDISFNTLEDYLISFSVSSKDAKSIRKAFGRLCNIHLGSVINWGTYDAENKTLRRTKPLSPDPRVFLYGLYKFAEACDGYHEFTLGRLLDFSIESSGMSPAEIFGMDASETEQYLHGLAHNYPDFITFSPTHGMNLVTLNKGNTAQDILDLF